MNRRIALALGAFGLFAMVGTEVAEAGRRGRVRFGGGGGVHIGARGGVSVHWSSRPRTSYRPRSWSLGGHIRIGRPYARYRYYRPYYYTPAYVPSYYGSTYYGASYYPVAPSASPGVVAVVEPRPQLPKLAIGLFAGGVSVEDTSESSDLGILGRVRLGQGGLLVEGEFGKQSYENDLRVDRRLGASLIWEICARNRFSPYLVAGLGVQQAEVAGEFTTNQNFAEIGVGIRFAITPKFHIAADVRAGSRDTMGGDGPDAGIQGSVAARTVAPPSGHLDDDNENYTRARLSALLYF